MSLAFTLTRLSRPAARRAFGRTWLGVCLAGAAATLLVVGGRHLVFVTMVWLVCVFAPVRIAIEVLHTSGPRLAEGLVRRLAARSDRYGTREHAVLLVEHVFAREVRLPRLAPPDLGAKVTDAAARICERVCARDADPLGMLQITATCATLLGRWTGAIAAGEAGGATPAPSTPAPPAPPPSGDGAAPPSLWDPRASIQDQWTTLRAVAGLAALVKVLAAVSEDLAGGPAEGGPALRTAADAAMDYADQIGLRLDGPAWEDVPGVPQRTLAPGAAGALAETWRVFCAAPPPAPSRLRAFVDAVFG